MKTSHRELLLKDRRGILEDCNLWNFWDILSGSYHNQILDYFENTPLFFDYTTLFKGDSRNDLYHGPIDSLGSLLIKPDLHDLDCFFTKFLEYSPSNYSHTSKWGERWTNAKDEVIQIWERIVKKSDDSERNYKLKQLELVRDLYIEDIYWTESHFFVQNYSAIVYKSYLNQECSIERFKNAFNFCYENMDRIKLAITKIYGWDKPLPNGIIEQYLIYLEKERNYDICVDIINEVKEKGWRNDFQKRLDRCIAKKTREVNTGIKK